MIPDSFIQDLLARVDIVDVIERYVPLKKGGANYSARCPFHNEKSPSFTVSPTKQFYYCFGCGAKGSAIGFVMEYAGLGFREAVQELASGIGLKVPDDDPTGRVRENGQAYEKVAADLHDVMSQAVDFYRDELKKSSRAIEYLKGRGLTGEIAARFRIGYAPDGWTPLAQAFPDYQAKALVDCGLVKEPEEEDGPRADGQKKRYDRFRDRIMFPIINQRGQTIGFGGRVLDKGEPKYLNSPETPIFDKGRELYGLPQARLAIRETGTVVVVEGYMDVVALAQMGVANCVAALGTATTPAHVQKLMKQADRIVFCFDGDTAGRKAAWRALENSLAHLADGRFVGFVFLPQGEDPDSFVRANGKEAFEELQANAKPLSEYLLEHLSIDLNLKTPEGRSSLLKVAVPLVLQISAPLLRLQIFHRLAEVGDVSRQEIKELYGKGVVPYRRSEALPSVRRAPVRESSMSLLELVALMPKLALSLDLTLFDRDTPHGAIAYVLAEWVSGNPLQLQTSAMLFEQFRDSDVQSMVARGSGSPRDNFEESELSQDFDNLQLALRITRYQQELNNLLLKSGNAHLSAEEDLRFMQLRRELESLKRTQSSPN